MKSHTTYLLELHQLVLAFRYGTGALAPNVVSPGVKDYICSHNLIIAHGKAYRLYEQEFKERQNG